MFDRIKFKGVKSINKRMFHKTYGFQCEIKVTVLLGLITH